MVTSFLELGHWECKRPPGPSQAGPSGCTVEAQVWLGKGLIIHHRPSVSSFFAKATCVLVGLVWNDRQIPVYENVLGFTWLRHVTELSSASRLCVGIFNGAITTAIN